MSTAHQMQSLKHGKLRQFEEEARAKAVWLRRIMESTREQAEQAVHEKQYLLQSNSKSTTEAQSAAEPKRPRACMASDICFAGSLDMMRAAKRVSVRPAVRGRIRL